MRFYCYTMLSILFCLGNIRPLAHKINAPVYNSIVIRFWELRNSQSRLHLSASFGRSRVQCTHYIASATRSRQSRDSACDYKNITGIDFGGRAQNPTQKMNSLKKANPEEMPTCCSHIGLRLVFVRIMSHQVSSDALWGWMKSLLLLLVYV